MLQPEIDGVMQSEVDGVERSERGETSCGEEPDCMAPQNRVSWTMALSAIEPELGSRLKALVEALLRSSGFGVELKSEVSHIVSTSRAFP